MCINDEGSPWQQTESYLTWQFFGSVAMAEAVATEWGLQVASSIGVTNGVVESDSLEVVELVNKRSGNMSEIFWVISKILEK